VCRYDAARPYALTESGDAEHFVDVFGDRVRFDHRRNSWLVFELHRWTPDADGQVDRLALEGIRLLQQQALLLSNLEEKKALSKWAIGGESRARLRNLLDLAKAMKPVSDSGDDWDADPWLLGCENGVLDLRTAELRPGRPEDRITMTVRASYDSNASCPLFERTVADIFGQDLEVIDYVKRAFGYSVSGITREQCLFVNYGGGGNGKGTLIVID
jgi:putative DNA primase/helicase